MLDLGIVSKKSFGQRLRRNLYKLVNKNILFIFKVVKERWIVKLFGIQ